MTLAVGWYTTARGAGSRGMFLAVKNALETGTLDARFAHVFCNRDQGDDVTTDRFFDLVHDTGAPLVTLSSVRFRSDHGGERSMPDAPLPEWREAEGLSEEAAKGYRRFVSAQNQYNVLDLPWQEGTIEAVQRHGLMLLPFFPLASGLLTGKYKKGNANPEGTRFGGDTFVASVLRDNQLNDERIDKVDRLKAFAEARGHSIVELAFSWLVSQPFVASVIAGATKPEQIVSNAQAANWELTADDFKAVADILAGEKAPA